MNQLLTTFPTTNLFMFSFPISAFTNGFWLYFWWPYQMFHRYIDSELKSALFFLWCCLYAQVECWTWVNPSLKTHIVWITKSVICWLWHLFAWKFYAYQFLLCHYLSNHVTEAHWKAWAFRLLLMHNPHFTRWQPSWFETRVIWTSSEDFAFLLWISPR